MGTKSPRMMKSTTAIVLTAPPVCMVVTMMAEDLAAAFALVWLLCSILCLAWGFYVSPQHRSMGWTCVGFGLIQFGLLLLPFFLPPRVSSAKQSCIACLKQLEGAKTTWRLSTTKAPIRGRRESC